MREKMQKMEDEMIIYSDLDRLKTEAEQKREVLESQKTELADRRVQAEEMLRDMEEKSISLRVTKLIFT